MTYFIDNSSVNKRGTRTGEWLIRESTCCVAVRAGAQISGGLSKQTAVAAAHPQKGKTGPSWGNQASGLARLADSVDSRLRRNSA